MADLHLLRPPILVTVLIVVGLQFLARDPRLRFDLGGVNQHILHPALFRNRVVIRGLVALVEGLQLGVGGMNSFADLILLEDGIFKLYFSIAAFKFLADVGVGGARAAGDQIAQLAHADEIFLQILKLRDRQFIALDEIFVPFLANKVATGEQDRPELSVLQFVPQLFIGGPQTHPVGFCDDYLLVD